MLHFAGSIYISFVRAASAMAQPNARREGGNSTCSQLSGSWGLLPVIVYYTYRCEVDAQLVRGGYFLSDIIRCPWSTIAIIVAIAAYIALACIRCQDGCLRYNNSRP